MAKKRMKNLITSIDTKSPDAKKKRMYPVNADNASIIIEIAFLFLAQALKVTIK